MSVIGIIYIDALLMQFKFHFPNLDDFPEINTPYSVLSLASCRKSFIVQTTYLIYSGVEM